MKKACKIKLEGIIIYVSDLKKDLRKLNEGGMIVGKKMILSIGFVYDIALM